MIIDSLSNSARYLGVHKDFPKAFAFLREQDPDNLAPGPYEIAGDTIRASATAKNGVPAGEAKFEAHDHHIDIQLCLSGNEQMGWKPREACHQPAGAYNAEKDVTFYRDTPDNYFRLGAGQFAIFFPEDVHAPMIGEGVIRKIVIKIRI